MRTLGGDKPVIPGVALSVERWPFHAEPPDPLRPTFVPARLVGLAVKLPCAFYTLRMISNHSEGNLWAPPLPLGGDRPSQTAHLTLSPRPRAAG